MPFPFVAMLRLLGHVSELEDEQTGLLDSARRFPVEEIRNREYDGDTRAAHFWLFVQVCLGSASFSLDLGHQTNCHHRLSMFDPCLQITLQARRPITVDRK